MLMLQYYLLLLIMIELIPITLRLKKNFAQVGRLIAKHNDKDFDKFISEEVSKIIFSISESSSTILTPPPISDELKQQIHKLWKKKKKDFRKILRKVKLNGL